MVKCDKCGDEDISPRWIINHVSYSGEIFSTMKSEMTVCDDCHEEMKESDRWKW